MSKLLMSNYRISNYILETVIQLKLLSAENVHYHGRNVRCCLSQHRNKKKQKCTNFSTDKLMSLLMLLTKI